MRNLIYIAVALSAFDLFGYKSPLSTYEDYVFTLPVNTNRITGDLMGPGGDYSAMRVEDVAFIYEAVCERNAVIEGTYDGFSVSNRFTVGLVKGSFPLSYTNEYPWTIHDDRTVTAYYDTNVVTDVTARLGIDKLWPEPINLNCALGWIDKDEKWPTVIEDATVPGSGDAAYTKLPRTVVAPTYVNPQAAKSDTNVLRFVVWPLKASVVEAYKFLAKTEKCVKNISHSASRAEAAKVTVDDNTTGNILSTEMQGESMSIRTSPAKDPLGPPPPVDAFIADLAEGAGVGKKWRWSTSKVYMKLYSLSYDYTTELKSWTDGQEANAVATYAVEHTVDDNEIVIDLGISKDVATTGVDRIKQVDIYWLGEIRNRGESNFMQGSGHPDRFGGEGEIADTVILGDFKDLQIVIPLADQKVVDIPHTNKVTNSATGESKDDVSYTIGVKITPDCEGWASKALELAGYSSYSALSSKLLGSLPAPNDSPKTPSPEKAPAPFSSGWDVTESSTQGSFDLVFVAFPDRAVVTCDLGTKIQEEEEDEGSPD